MTVELTRRGRAALGAKV